MQCPKIDLDNIPSSISEFFTPEEFAAISEYEKQHLSNLRQNFEAFRRAGLPVRPPDFMLRNKSYKEKQKLICPPFIESSDGSDSEWTPALERANKPRANKKRKLFKPPKTVCTGKNVEEEHKKQRKNQMEATSKEDEVHVYLFRKERVTSYMSLAVPEDDDFLYCEECNHEYDGDCPEHGALICIDDAKVPLMGPNCEEYSNRTLPEGLEIKISKIPNAGLGVFAVKDFPARTRFGPYRGKKETNEAVAHESGYSWQIMKDEQTSHFVDARDPCESNWMRFVNCARHEEEQCVTAYQYKGEIYYRSHKHIFAGTEILVYYGDSYARDLGIQIQKFSRKVQGNENVTEFEMCGANDNIHSCTQCQLSFSTFQYLQKHMKHRHNDKYWEMKQNEMFGDVQPEVKIMKESKAERNLGDFNFRGTESENNVPEKKCTLNIHMTKVSNGLNFQNEGSTSELNKTVCNTDRHAELGGTGSMNTKCLVEYKKSRQAREKDFRCDVCGIKFDDSHCLKEHKRIHTGEKSYKCDVCSVGFNQLVNLKTHKRIHTGEKPYKCDVCSVGFNKSGHLKRHKRIHTGEKPYKCDVCSVGFNQLGSLKRHKRIHTGEKPYKCDVCSVGFTTSSDLKKHKRIHTGEKPYKCDVCSVGFTTSSHLKKHKRIHTGEKPYKCDVCCVGFNESGSLKKHKRIHTGEKPYKCDVCSVGFTTSSDLKKHKRIHTGEKPYKCDVCSVGFTTSSHLKKHKRIHTGEKPYKCDVCSVGFNESGSLKKHKRIHTGEKPYKCDVCSVGFTYIYQLKQHCNKHKEL